MTTKNENCKYAGWTKDELKEELKCQKYNRQIAEDRSNYQYELLLCHSDKMLELGMQLDEYHDWLMKTSKMLHEKRAKYAVH